MPIRFPVLPAFALQFPIQQVPEYAARYIDDDDEVLAMVGSMRGTQEIPLAHAIVSRRSISRNQLTCRAERPPCARANRPPDEESGASKRYEAVRSRDRQLKPAVSLTAAKDEGIGGGGNSTVSRLRR